MLKDGTGSEQQSGQAFNTGSGGPDNCSLSTAGESASVCTLNDVKGPKYKLFYNRLYKCLCFLESENKKLIEAVQRKERLTGQAKRLDELLDEFAFRVASKKDQYEKSLAEQATSEGQQAFMAKRWKTRYHNLLDIATLLEKQLHDMTAEDKKDKKIDDSKMKSFFDEVLSLPWDSTVKINNALANAVEDITDDLVLTTKRKASLYEFNDFTIPISSVFIQDLLANHNICAEEIKRQNEIKHRLFHVLKKTKEQRNQLKKYVTEQENHIQTIEKAIQEAQISRKDAILTNSINAPGSTTSEANKVSNNETNLNVREQTVDMQRVKLQELEKLKHEAHALEFYKRELEGMIKEEEQQRRVLSRRLHDLVGTIHVTCRIKPHPNNYLEIISDDKLLVPKTDSAFTITTNKNGHAAGSDSNQMRCFIFEKVLGPGVGHYEIFKKLGQPLTMCLEGQNMCVMTYGSRSSGKSFTMFGKGDDVKSNENTESIKGIAQNAVHLLFSLARQRTSWNYEICVRVLAVTDEVAVDLLKADKCTFLKLAKSAQVELDDTCCLAQVMELTTGSEFDALVQTIREVDSNKGNQVKHIIIKLTIEGVQKSSKDVNMRSILLLADLASWEKRFSTDELDIVAARSTPTSDNNSRRNGVAPMESNDKVGVNQSLLALSRVFTALRKRKIPVFKNTILTKILKPVLTGESKCFLIITIDSDPNEYTSTLASLQFAQNAMQATTRSAVHRSPLFRINHSIPVDVTR